MVEIKERLNITLTSRMKRQVRDIAEDKGLSMNQLINDALKNYIDRVNFNHSAPDYVADRLNQVLVSQMNLSQQVQTLIDKQREEAHE